MCLIRDTGASTVLGFGSCSPKSLYVFLPDGSRVLVEVLAQAVVEADGIHDIGRSYFA